MPCFLVESNIFIYRCPATVKQGREVCDAEFITSIIWIKLIKFGGEAIGGEFWPADSLPFLSGIFHAGFHALGNDIPFHLGKDTPHHQHPFGHWIDGLATAVYYEAAYDEADMLLLY